MRIHNRRSGFALIASTLSILVLLGFLGSAFDVGFLQYQKRRLQSAADAAAQGAAIQLATNASNTTAIAEGKLDSGLNGFTNGSNGVTVTINIPPLSGNYTAKGQTAEAIVTQSDPTFFMQLFNTNSVTVAARGVATAGNSPNCIYALDPTAQDAFLAAEVANAARAGAQWAAINPGHPNNLTAMQTAATNDAVDVTNLTATASEFCQCDDGTSVNCTSGTCLSGSVRTYVKVVTSAPYNTFATYPWIPKPINLAGRAVLRVD